MSRPGFFFYTGDWIKDTRSLSLEARGAWIDLLCALHEAGGSITWPLVAFDQYLGTIERDGFIYSADDILNELVTLNICHVSVTSDNRVTVTSRRISRDANSKENHRKRQKRYRERRSRDGPVTNERDASSSSSSYSSLKKEEERNTQLRDGGRDGEFTPEYWKNKLKDQLKVVPKKK